MSVRTVLRDDVRNTRRSFVVLGVVGVLTLLVALIVGSDASAHDYPYRALFDVSFFFFLALPLIITPLTYLAVAGDRDSGAIKHALGLPNTRAEYLAAKYLSRGAVAVAGVLVALVVGFVVAQFAYPNPPDPVRFVKFAGVSALFALSMTGIFVALSSMTSKRSRAMFGVITAYFVLGPFWLGFLPVVNLGTIIDTATSALGVTLTEQTLGLIQTLSPTTAYLTSTEFVYAGVLDNHEMLARNFQSDEYFDQLWFTSLVMGLWAAVTLTIGYVRFRAAELG